MKLLKATPLSRLPISDDENKQKDEQEKASDEPPEKNLRSESFWCYTFGEEKVNHGCWTSIAGLEEKARKKLERYTKEAITGTIRNYLHCWKDTIGIYLILSHHIQHYMCTQATSVPPVQGFNATGKIVDKKGCSLHRTNVKMLFFCPSYERDQAEWFADTYNAIVIWSN